MKVSDVMEEVNTVILENGLEYMEVDEINFDNKEYVLLVNCKNVKDSCIRRVEITDNQEYLCKIKDELEYDKVLKLFIKKNKVLF